MNYLVAFLIFGICFLGMAVGLIFAKKILEKGCCSSPDDPDATCGCKSNDEKDKGHALKRGHAT